MVRVKPNDSTSDLDIKSFTKTTGTKEVKGRVHGGWSGGDRRLLFLHVEKHGAGNWTAAAYGVPGKTAKQCRDQWIKTLSPFIQKACQAA